MSIRSFFAVLVVASPAIAPLAASFVFAPASAHVPVGIIFLSLPVCVVSLLIGFFGSLIFAVKTRAFAWVLVTVATLAAGGMSAQILHDTFRFGS